MITLNIYRGSQPISCYQASRSSYSVTVPHTIGWRIKLLDLDSTPISNTAAQSTLSDSTPIRYAVQKIDFFFS